MKTIIVNWMVGIMTTFSNPEKVTQHQQFPGYEETVEERKARYVSIASDLYDVVYSPETKPVFGGETGRAATAALVLAIAYHESGFSKDVDLGPCYRGKDGKSSRCDGGKAYCMMQVHMLHTGMTSEGWTGEELFQDRKKCFATAIKKIRGSIGQCKNNPREEKLAAYADGLCETKKGKRGSRELFALYDRARGMFKLPKSEKEVPAS